MKKVLLALAFVFSFIAAQSQTQPSGLPSPRSDSGFAQYNWIRALNGGIIFPSRDTLFTPTYIGSVVFWRNPLGDSSLWIFRQTTGRRWARVVTLNSGVATGTVTSIAQGFGILSTPNPITTTGTVTVDTLAMSTKANVQKVKDSTLGVLADSLRTYVKLQNGVLYRQTGKFWISGDTALIDGLALVGRLSASQASGIPAINGQNTSTGRAGSFTAATGVGAYITNRSATNPALYVLQDSTSSIARFVNNFDLGVMIDTSADITISNLRSSGAFTGKIQLPTISANRTYALPNASGTIALTSNVTDSSAALRASINTKLNISDTAAMLANRLKISDTLTMLSPYLRKSDTATMLAPFVQYSDTSNQMSGYLRKNFALLLQDTATAFSVRPLNNRFLDSISAIRTLANSKYTGGTVTSVATNNGTGITGGTITTTGTLAIDTATTISTKLNVLNQLNKYTGSTNIVTLGTITTGVWNGTAIANANLQNSSITINGNSVSLGGSTTVTANTPNSITFNNGGAGGASGSTFNGGSALTVSYNTLGALATADTAAMKATITLDRVLQAGNTTGRTFTAGGATLTGALSGTSGTFSGSLSTNGVTAFVAGVNIGNDATFGSELGYQANANTSSRRWKLASDRIVFGDFAIQQSTTQFGSTYDSKIYINPSGNVGIGTTSPVLNLNGGTYATIYNDAANGWLELATGSTTDGFGGGLTFNNVNRSGSDKRIAQISAGRKGANNTGELSFLTWNAGTPITAMTISPAGNTLIKTTTDNGTDALQVAGSVSATGRFYSQGIGFNTTSSAELFLKNTTSSTGREWVLNSANSGIFQIADNTASGATRFSIDNTGAATFSSSVKATYFSESYTSVSTTYTVADNIGTVYASSNTYTITLPSASGNAGRTITIKRTSSGLGTSITISGVTLGTSENGGSLPCHAAAIYKSDGTNWYCISYHAGGCN